MQRSHDRSQMGPAAGGDPYVQAVSINDGWLTVELKRTLADLPQRVHIVCRFADGAEQAIHEQVAVPSGTKHVTVRFKPTANGRQLSFEPVTHMAATPPTRSLPPDIQVPTWIQFIVKNAIGAGQEFDTVAARIEQNESGVTIDALDEDRSLGADPV